MYYGDKVVKIEELLGKNFVRFEKAPDELTFFTDQGETYKFLHQQDCCESVTIDDIAGDLNDLLNSPITKAEVVTSSENPEGVTKEYQDSFTWTFYHLATLKGYVTVRWYGESNGYYSEEVELVKI